MGLFPKPAESAPANGADITGDGAEESPGRLFAISGNATVAVKGDRLFWWFFAGGHSKPKALPLPPGRVVAVTALGPQVIVAGGDLYGWDGTKWRRVGNVFKGRAG